MLVGLLHLYLVLLVQIIRLGCSFVYFVIFDGCFFLDIFNQFSFIKMFLTFFLLLKHLRDSFVELLFNMIVALQIGQIS